MMMGEGERNPGIVRKLLVDVHFRHLIAQYMKRSAFVPLTFTVLTSLSVYAGPQRPAGLPHDTTYGELPAGTITAGGKFGSHLESGMLDALVPFARVGDITLFGDLRGTWDDNSQFLLSTGLGVRYLVPGRDIIIGGNVYYDFIDSKSDNHFDQFGFGAEVLTRWLDARFNYYLPDGSVQTVGNSLASLQLESGIEGWNTEAGFLIPGLDKYVEARLFAGYYSYHSKVGVNFEGWKARAEIRWTPGITTDLEWWEGNSARSNSLNGGNWVAGVRVSLPFEIGNIAQGKNPFAGAGDALRFGKQRKFSERLGETVLRSHRVQTATSTPVPQFVAPPPPPPAAPRPSPSPTPTPPPM